MEKILKFASSKELGYLTSDLGKVGTGLQTHLNINLPKLKYNHEQLGSIARKHQLYIQKYDGNNPDDDEFIVYNTLTLGKSEKQLV